MSNATDKRNTEPSLLWQENEEVMEAFEALQYSKITIHYTSRQACFKKNIFSVEPIELQRRKEKQADELATHVTLVQNIMDATLPLQTHINLAYNSHQATRVKKVNAIN